ncbi:TetR/AcrR family transcriptional regulator [Acaryochloris marina]|uniref:TetR/AcrR family transcriptional regulator n=1 Tax=Acaryochloris marina TaxID=155978 RepID=UPI001BAF7B32|nr:TetR/AcrR family transcriptional regulator [Acaryochloris marina]QUY42800.1 TetR family transcriptional regulator C-terminal domain-containing protein [Acaryochloris marina S15]
MARPRRNDNTRERLLDEGLKLFISQGYHGTGIKEVVDQVNVPKGSFYNYFESKEHFAAEVIRHYSQQLIACMSDQLKEPEDNAFMALKNFFEREVQRHQDSKTGCLIGNLGAELGGSSELCRQAMIEGLEGMKQQFSQTLKRGQSRNVIRDDISAEELADFLVNAYEGALLRMQLEQSVKPIEKMSSFLSSYLVCS